jgi:hypothetical protein
MDSGFRRNDEEARFRPKALARSHTRPRVLQYFIVIPAKAEALFNSEAGQSIYNNAEYRSTQ